MVVGAGLAGLSCAYRLREAGLQVDLFEASARVGGRCRTERSVFEQDDVLEVGGELIDDLDVYVWSLATELDLELEEVPRPEGLTQLLQIGGEAYSADEVLDDLDRVQQAPADGSSAADWVQEHVPGGSRSRLGRLLTLACTLEHGAEASSQSAVGLRGLVERARREPPSFVPWPGRRRISGGNDELTTRLTAQIGSRLNVGHTLLAIELDAPSSTYTLTFSQPGGDAWRTSSEHVVLAIPFSSLRSVDCARAGFEPRKAEAIAALGVGSHSKLHLRFSSRHWRGLGCDGQTLAEESGTTWEARDDGRESATLAALANAPADELVQRLDPLLPGVSEHWTGQAALQRWPASRSYYRVGQAAELGGIEGERQGNCHFAGEHTALSVPGTIEGAVESGERAAAEILGDLT